MKKFILILLLPCIAFSQGFKVKQVPNFSGGLVNSFANSIMDDNMSIVLENYDITKIGELKRRKGYSSFYSDAYSGQDASSLIPYFGVDHQLLVMRAESSFSAIDSVSYNVDLLNLCEDAICTTTVREGFYQGLTSTNVPYNISHTHWFNDLYIASKNSEFVVYNGSEVIPARPIDPGQSRIAVIEGQGSLRGTYEYRYLFKENSGGTYSAPSVTSYPAQVDSGSIFLFELDLPANDSSGFISFDSLIILRRNTEADDSLWFRIGQIPNTQDYFHDTIADTFTFSSTYKYGFHASHEFYPYAPGGMSLNIIDTVDYNGVVVPDGSGIGNASLQLLQYQIVAIDSADQWHTLGRSAQRLLDTIGSATGDSTVLPTLYNIPTVPSSYYKYKLVLRSSYYQFSVSGQHDAMYVTIDTLPCSTTTYKDNIAYVAWMGDRTIDTSLKFLQQNCPLVWNDTAVFLNFFSTKLRNGLFASTDGSNFVDYSCSYDSSITFRPVSLIISGSRAYAVGDPLNKNTLYYSEFGFPRKWATNKTINVQSDKGDWFNGLMALEDDKIVIFRQNSIFQLSGLSYYQFSMDEIIGNIGLTAQRSLAKGKNTVYFLHESGAYLLGRFGGLIPTPFSVPIENSLDSSSAKRTAWGDFIDNGYWLSINNKTYIYTDFPSPHWKCYSFSVKDAVVFNHESSADYDPKRSLILLDDNKIYDWDYSDADTLDDTTHIIATYQSKYFFDDPIRENIKYIDIKGEGICDSLIVSLYDKTDSNKDGILIRTDTISVDFTDGLLDRLYYDNIVSQLSVRIQDFGEGDYTLQGYDIGYLPWDEGKAK